MRVDEKELRRIVNKHLIMTEVKRSYALSLLKEENSINDKALELTLKSLEAIKGLTSADADVINDIEFWKNVKVVATGIGTLAALGGLGWASTTPIGRFVPIKLKLMGAAAILAAGGGAYYYITSGAEAEITKAKAVKAINSEFDKFLKNGNPAKVFDRNIRKTLRSGGISVPSNDGAASDLVYTPPETVPKEITSPADAAEVGGAIDTLMVTISDGSQDKVNKANNLLGVPLSSIAELGGSDTNAQKKTAAIIADLIVGLNDGDGADDQVKEIFRALCSHPACEWDNIDMMVGEIFIKNMGKYDDEAEPNLFGITSVGTDTDMSVYTYGSDPEKGLYFDKSARPGNQIEMTPNELDGYVNTRNHSVIYKCILGFDFTFDDYNISTEIDSLAKAAIEDALGSGEDGGLLNNFVAIEDSRNVMIPNYQEMSGGVLAKAKNIAGKTRFGAPFIVQLGELAKSKKDEDEGTILEKAKAKVDEALADIAGISLPGLGNIKNILMGAIPALIGGTAGAVGGGILGGWIGALIGGLLGGLTGYYAPVLYDYITTEYFSGEKDDKDGGGPTTKPKDKNPVPLPTRLSGLSRTAKGRVEKIEGIVNEYNKFYKITEDTIPADETWEGGGTGKTDAVWRNPFIKHVFANDTVMKTKTFAPSVNSGKLWVWRELSRALISDHPEFTPDTAGCLAFCQFVYGNISSTTRELDGGGPTKLTDTGELDDSNDDSKKPKYKKDSKYAGPDEIEIGFRLKKALRKDKKPSSEDTRFYKKVENATFLDDIDPNVSERIKIALIRSMKVNILVSGKNGHDVFTDETYNVTFSNAKGKVQKITSQDFLTGRFEKPKAKIRDVIDSYADDNLKKVLKDSELAITFRGPGKYRVPKELNERVLRKVIRKLLIEKSY